MLYYIIKAPPSRPRLFAIHISHRLIALAIASALLLQGVVYADDVSPLVGVSRVLGARRLRHTARIVR